MDFKSHLPHFDQNVIDSDNPWKASSIFEFHYFCCPECDCKSHTKQAFVDHASTYHTWVSYIIFKIFALHPLSWRQSKENGNYEIYMKSAL